MSCNAIEINQVEKLYHLYKTPSDRFWEFFSKNTSKFSTCHTALYPLSFELPKGEVLGIVGENGAGKSTLLQLICKTLTPTSGSIHVNGSIAALLELGSGFNPEFTGRENVYLNASILGLQEDEINAQFDDIVEFSGIDRYIDQPVKTYSSGMLVRLAFSVAISVQPDILVIDEALSVGDGAFARKSFDKIMELKQNGTTILFCTHNLYQVEAICSQAIWLKNGQCAAHGTPQQVVKKYEAYLHGKVQENTPQKLFDSSNSNQSSQPLSSPPKLTNLNVLLDKKRCSLTENPIGISGHSTLTIDAEWYCPEDLPPPSFAITIHAADSRMIGSAGTHIDEVTTTCLNNHGHVSVEFNNLPLLKGEYWIEAYLLCEQGILFYDQRVPCARFEVKQEENILEQGLVHLSRRWQT